ncbi:MAG: acetyl-CoA carboxylase carboxyl transferase subunit alpha, partial [Candidatus Hydrothermae bacterium]|nr:acetyl-CoA carboxylase carboxyl transferase subunit alpha [Candidatus Hydrothermae bacterium]
MAVLEFEKPIVELEKRVQELTRLAEQHPEIEGELEEIRQRLDRLKREIYSRLSRWDRVQIARHPDRPHALDFIHGMLDEFVELHGDRTVGDD